MRRTLVAAVSGAVGVGLLLEAYGDLLLPEQRHNLTMQRWMARLGLALIVVAVLQVRLTLPGCTSDL